MMAVAAVSIITPAFPKIVEELVISRTQVGLLITTFTLPAVFLAPFTGLLADRFGRKQILVPSLLIFGLAGGACALIKNFNVLLVLRTLQGIGGASLGSINLTILGDLFSDNERTEAMGLNSSVLAMSISLYPMLGGALAMLSWSYPFLIALVAIPIGFLVMFGLQSPAPRNKQSFRQYIGGAWKHFRKFKVIVAFTAGVIIFIMLYGTYLTYLSLYLDASFQASPFIIGLIISSRSFTAGIVASQLGKLSRRFSPPTLTKIGLVLSGLGLVLFPIMPRLEYTLIPAFIFGLGGGVMTPGLQVYVASLAPNEYRGIFMSINATMFRLGQTLGPLIFGVIYSFAEFDGVFFFGAGLAFVAAAAGFAGARMVR